MLLEEGVLPIHRAGPPSWDPPQAPSLRLSFVFPSPTAAHTKRTVPWGQPQPEKGWGHPMLLAGLSKERKVLQRK